MDSQTLTSITTRDGVRIAYRFDDERDKPVLLLSNSIGTDLHMWDGQVPALTEHFRLLRYDARGHGASDVPSGPYSLDRLGRDVVELLDALGLQRVHVLGLSLGGIVAQWLGIHVPERVDRLVLSNTAAYLGPPQQWDRPIAELLAAPDMQATTEMFLHNWFPAHMLQENNEVVEGFAAHCSPRSARAWPAAGLRCATTTCAAQRRSSAIRHWSSRASTTPSRPPATGKS
jgi:3-oxoadipate enol-lactonase